MQIFWIRIQDGKGFLDSSETRHCIKVLRHQKGDVIHGVDGMGHFYECRILQYDKEQTALEIIHEESNWGEHGRSLHLAVSPLRLKDRFEWLIEKAVELGVNDIYPIHCQRTDRYQAKFKVSRLETIMLTALKQCKRSKLPRLHPIQSFTDFITYHQSNMGFIAYGNSPDSVRNYQGDLKISQEATFLIGPEGDFTEAEIEWAESNGYNGIHLGTNRLRTETAGIYALSMIKWIWEY